MVNSEDVMTVIIIKQDVKIDGAWSPLNSPVFAEFSFYSLQEVEQFEHCIRCLYFYCKVDEIVLLPVSPWFRSIV